MLTLNMQNMKGKTMVELAKNLKEVAESIAEGFNAGVMVPGCIWKVEGDEEVDETEKQYRFTFQTEVLIKAKSEEEASLYFEDMQLLSDDSLNHSGKVSHTYNVEQCK